MHSLLSVFLEHIRVRMKLAEALPVDDPRGNPGHFPAFHRTFNSNAGCNGPCAAGLPIFKYGYTAAKPGGVEIVLLLFDHRVLTLPHLRLRILIDKSGWSA